MKRLGDVDLPPGMMLEQTGQALGRASASRMALSGRVVHFAAPALRRITLASQADSGWLPPATAAALHALRATAQAPTLLWLDGADHLHCVTAWDEEAGPALACAPLWPGAAWALATIRLIILEDV